MFIGGIGGRAADERPRLVQSFHRSAPRLVTEEGVMGYLEEPRAEFAFVSITRQRQIGFDQGVLGKVVGIILVATAQGKQETSQGLLLMLHMCYEDFACH